MKREIKIIINYQELSDEQKKNLQKEIGRQLAQMYSQNKDCNSN